jgi:hypothetical protein
MSSLVTHHSVHHSLPSALLLAMREGSSNAERGTVIMMVYIGIVASYQQCQEVMCTKRPSSNYQQEAKPTSFRAAKQSLTHPSSARCSVDDDQPCFPALIYAMPCQSVFFLNAKNEYRISATMASSIVPHPSPSTHLEFRYLPPSGCSRCHSCEFDR